MQCQHMNVMDAYLCYPAYDKVSDFRIVSDEIQL